VYYFRYRVYLRCFLWSETKLCVNYVYYFRYRVYLRCFLWSESCFCLFFCFKMWSTSFCFVHSWYSWQCSNYQWLGEGTWTLLACWSHPLTLVNFKPSDCNPGIEFLVYLVGWSWTGEGQTSFPWSWKHFSFGEHSDVARNVNWGVCLTSFSLLSSSVLSFSFFLSTASLPLPFLSLSLRSKTFQIQLEVWGKCCKSSQLGMGQNPRHDRICYIVASKYELWWQQF